MKNVFTFCCALCLLALTACGSAPKISEEASDLEVNNHEGVTMTVVDGSAYPGQVKVTILNATDTEIDSGNSADFFLQVEQDGQWYDLEENGDFSNTAEAYIFEKDMPREMAFQWAGRYGSLDTGHYRAVIALGSDFDGIDGPHQLENAAFLPLLADALRKEGFTEDEVEGIYYRNAMRFFEENL